MTSTCVLNSYWKKPTARARARNCRTARTITQLATWQRPGNISPALFFTYPVHRCKKPTPVTSAHCPPVLPFSKLYCVGPKPKATARRRRHFHHRGHRGSGTVRLRRAQHGQKSRTNRKAGSRLRLLSSAAWPRPVRRVSPPLREGRQSFPPPSPLILSLSKDPRIPAERVCGQHAEPSDVISCSQTLWP